MHTHNQNVLPERLAFSIGSSGEGCYEIQFMEGKLRIRYAKQAYVWRATSTIAPLPEAWGRFWSALDSLEIWNWRQQYDNDNHAVLEGTQWSLQLAHQGRSLRCGGSNAYPGSEGPTYGNSSSFAKFINALGNLTGLEIH